MKAIAGTTSASMTRPWPSIGPRDAPYILILNVVPFIGGLGTIVAGLKDGRNRLRDVAVGLCQILIPFVGWAWAVWWGAAMYRDARR